MGCSRALFLLNRPSLAKCSAIWTYPACMYPQICGIGKALFLAAKGWARKRGGRKLYISSHSAAETQAFYQAMGCVDAQVYVQAHVDAEPFDRQLECAL